MSESMDRYFGCTFHAIPRCFLSWPFAGPIHIWRGNTYPGALSYAAGKETGVEA